jgi:purine-cytosine permease-like protein
LLPFALRLFQWQQTFVARRELLDVQNGVVGCLCLCVCFVLAVSNRFSGFLLFLQTVFSNFLNVLRVCC